MASLSDIAGNLTNIVDTYNVQKRFSASMQPNPVTAGQEVKTQMASDFDFLQMSATEVASIDGNSNISNNKINGGAAVSLRTTDFVAYQKALNPAFAGGNTAASLTYYQKYNTTTRIGVINPNNISYPNRPSDGVNSVSLFYAANPPQIKDTFYDINGQPVTRDNIRDMIKFRIKAFDNDKPGSGVYMVFRAFLNGAISNPISPAWNPIKYTGRAESFYAYEGTTEEYSLSFTIAALSRQEMKPLYQKLNYLKASLYPDYVNNKMRGTFFELTVGDLIKYQPGIISGLTITIPEDANWDVAISEPENGPDKDMHELPMMVKVDLSFIPIYNFLPRKSSHAPFIGIDDALENPVTVSTQPGVPGVQHHTGPKEWLTPYQNSTFNNI